MGVKAGMDILSLIIYKINDTKQRERAFLPSLLMTAAGYTRSSMEFKDVKPKERHLVSHLEVLFITI